MVAPLSAPRWCRVRPGAAPPILLACALSSEPARRRAAACPFHDEATRDRRHAAARRLAALLLAWGHTNELRETGAEGAEAAASDHEAHLGHGEVGGAHRAFLVGPAPTGPPLAGPLAVARFLSIRSGRGAQTPRAMPALGNAHGQMAPMSTCAPGPAGPGGRPAARGARCWRGSPSSRERAGFARAAAATDAVSTTPMDVVGGPVAGEGSAVVITLDTAHDLRLEGVAPNTGRVDGPAPTPCPPSIPAWPRPSTSSTTWSWTWIRSTGGPAHSSTSSASTPPPGRSPGVAPRTCSSPTSPRPAPRRTTSA